MTKIKKLFALVCLSPLTLSTAAEPDFYIHFSTCKNAAGYLALSDESLKIIPGEPLIMACFKAPNDVMCFFEFKDGQKGHKGNSENYKIIIDSPPHLHFRTENGSAYIAINTVQHAAVSITRFVDTQVVGAKVCQGPYTTNFEVNKYGK